MKLGNNVRNHVIDNIQFYCDRYYDDNRYLFNQAGKSPLMRSRVWRTVEQNLIKEIIYTQLRETIRYDKAKKP